MADAEARQALMMAAEMPADIGPLVLRYLGLFRPRARSLAWSRALRLMTDIHEWLRTGRIRRRGRDWQVTADSLRWALEEVLRRRDKLELPLEDHAYLLEVLASAADRSEARAEAQREAERRQTPPGPRAEATAPAEEAVPAAAIINAVTLLVSEDMARKRSGLPPLRDDEARPFLARIGHVGSVADRAIERWQRLKVSRRD